MMRNIGWVALLATLGVLSACGGNSGPTSFTTSSSGSSSSGASSSGASSTSSSGSTASTFSMGNGTGTSFQKGAIGISGLTSGALSAGGVAGLDLSIVNQAGTLYSGTAVSITLSSTCISQGLATIAPTAPTVAGSTANAVSTTTGTAALTYTAHGCSGPDALTATAAVNGQTLTATGSISVAAAAIGSIQFKSASPASIGLKGTGLGETSTVTFQVLDSTGNPRPNAAVTFTLSTSVGGIGLQPATATSAADGTVQTVVSSGTQHTSVRVTASIASPALSTQSGILTVTTGLPASGAFSIAVGKPTYLGGASAPACGNVEAYNQDGVTVPITVRLADRYNNPAPDGTSVAFTTAGGHIDGSCTTPSSKASPNDGTCSVNWVSANPRPTPSSTPPASVNGRSVILATAIGEESFQDTNGNGFWDTGEPFSDLGEPYRDDNENNAYGSGEYFLDFNQNGMRDPGSGTFKGITCSGSGASATCSTTTLAIGVQSLIVMSTTRVTVTSDYANPTPSGGTNSFHITLIDDNGNPVAAGTSISISSDSAIGSVTGPATSFVAGCASGAISTQATLTAPKLATGVLSASGNIYVSVTSPGSGNVTPLTIPVTVQ